MPLDGEAVSFGEVAVVDEQFKQVAVPVFAVDVSLLADDVGRGQIARTEWSALRRQREIVLVDGRSTRAVEARQQKRLGAASHMTHAREVVAEPDRVLARHAEEQARP